MGVEEASQSPRGGYAPFRTTMFDLTLTFDNGPEPDVTPSVLDVLAANHVAATFFVLGRKIADPAARDLSIRAHGEGHWIGNHTWTHDVPLGEQTGPDVAETEIGRTQAVLGELTRPERLFRPFGGGGNLDRRLLSPAALVYLRNGGFTCVLWNAVPRDWADPDGWVETALAQCAARPWTLMVLHDLPTGAMRHLSRFVDAVRLAGGRFRQDFPADCVPLQEGRRTGPIDGFVAPADGASITGASA